MHQYLIIDNLTTYWIFIYIPTSLKNLFTIVFSDWPTVPWMWRFHKGWRTGRQPHPPCNPPPPLEGTSKDWRTVFTFKIIRQPSEQLLSIYGINQKDDCMKQVPLLFVRIYFSATWIAVKEVFSDARVQGCSFTGDRRWWGSVADLGLKTAYEEWHIYHQARFAEPLSTCDSSPTHHLWGNCCSMWKKPGLTAMYVESARGPCFDWRLGLTTMLEVHIFSMTNFYAIL